MPNYIQNISRVPKLGKFNSVLERQVETLKSLNRPGNISFSVSNSLDMDGAIITALPFNSISEVEDFHDAFRSNPDAVKGFDDIASDCEKVNIQLLRVVEPGVMSPGAVKYVVRHTFVAKRGEVQNLVGVVSELRNAMDTTTHLITVPVAGNLDIVRATIGVSSLEELETITDEIATDKIQAVAARISELTVRSVRSLSIIEYASQG
ncbi:MAG TPA: hypothetical protein EYO88_02545 [Alphaproteobacteria bacterium]|nr:hypothetical protein [Alphaproteobacteria bacterium]